jgi:hypothetical protein
MLRSGKAVGAIGVGRSGPGGAPRPYTDKEITLLQTFADQGVIAIENVRLFRKLEARTAELTRFGGPSSDGPDSPQRWLRAAISSPSWMGFRRGSSEGARSGQSWPCSKVSGPSAPGTCRTSSGRWRPDSRTGEASCGVRSPRAAGSSESSLWDGSSSGSARTGLRVQRAGIFGPDSGRCHRYKGGCGSISESAAQV